MESNAASFSKYRLAIILSIAASTPIASSAHAEQVPRWEAGAGVAVIDFPHYRGSNERRSYVLPVPYFIYHGDILKVDRQRVRGLFFHNDYAELDVSMNGSVPVKDNVARQGMPDLDPTLEIGPSLNFHLYQTKSNQTRLELRLPLRSVIASDFSYLHDVGWMFHPVLNLDVENVFNQKGWNLGMGIGSIFTDRRYNQYFYGVDARYVIQGRPVYAAGGGYAGRQFVAALSKRFPKMWVSGFVKWDSLRGAVFEDSPLVKSKQTITAGFAISWVLSESAIKVEEEK